MSVDDWVEMQTSLGLDVNELIECSDQLVSDFIVEASW